MYKIEIQFKKIDNEKSSLEAFEITNKETTKFEKATGSILRDYIKKALKEFNNEIEKDNDVDSIDDLDGVLKDLLDDLKNLKETMKDKKKED